MIANLKSCLQICYIDMYSTALYLITEVYCNCMFRIVYSHLQVNSRHTFQAPACRIQQERVPDFFVKVKYTRLIIYHSGKNEIKLVVIIALRVCPIFICHC